MYQSQSLHPKFRSFLALSTCYQTGRQGHLTENRCAVFLEEPASEEGESKSISKWVVSLKEYFSQKQEIVTAGPEVRGLTLGCGATRNLPSDLCHLLGLRVLPQPTLCLPGGGSALLLCSGLQDQEQSIVPQFCVIKVYSIFCTILVYVLPNPAPQHFIYRPRADIQPKRK